MKETLRTYITETLLSNGLDSEVGEDSNLLLSGLIDSLGVMMLVQFIEERFQIDIPPEDVTMEHFLSINTIESYLRQRRS